MYIYRYINAYVCSSAFTYVYIYIYIYVMEESYHTLPTSPEKKEGIFSELFNLLRLTSLGDVQDLYNWLIFGCDFRDPSCDLWGGMK